MDAEGPELGGQTRGDRGSLCPGGRARAIMIAKFYGDMDDTRVSV